MGSAQSVESDLEHIISLTRKGEKETLEECLKQSSRFRNVINVRDSDGWTPLHWASTFKSSLIPLLLVYGADVHIKDNDGSSPLHLACRNCKTKGTRNLINAQADVNMEDHFKRTPLHRAARFGTPLCIRMLIVAGAEVDRNDKECKTPLYFAAQSRRSDNVKILLDNDAFDHAVDIHGTSPFSLTEQYVKKHEGKGPSARIMKLLRKANPTETHVPSLKQICRHSFYQNKQKILALSDNNLPTDLLRYLGM